VIGQESEETVRTGFEPVRQLFLASLDEFGPGGGGFAAYVGGELVVDLWGGVSRPGVPWEGGDLAAVMSATKGLVTVCAQLLVDRGLLDVEAPVTRYWPEFGQAGKESILVRHILTHTSGVLGFGSHRPPLQWDGTGWDDYDAIAAGLAAAAPAWTPPGSKFGYHALTYGWLMGELIRRITGQTLGGFFRAEIAAPLGLDIWIGTPPDVRPRVAHITDHTRDGIPWIMRLVLRRALAAVDDPATLPGQAFAADGTGSLSEHLDDLFNKGSALSAEVPSAGGTATARSLARVYAMLSMGGGLDGVRLVSPETVERFAAQQISMQDQLLLAVVPRALRRAALRPVRRTLGYLVNPVLPGARRGTFGPNPDSYGHDGLGGQIAFCDPLNRIAVGYVRNDLVSREHHSGRLIETLYRCAGTGQTRLSATMTPAGHGSAYSMPTSVARAPARCAPPTPGTRPAVRPTAAGWPQACPRPWQ
jgi:CubicO group peptidase (beta-lactamase class C family)